ncbi:uncharacterized protein BJ171DRAFT_632146 [Polychytrium aggregatum]|uniref:uncharacterized protein n=1 Tax=Polychytrium aggregatum TaxID=110093 RepID=UPI0022FDC17D|nr:uncharacterized protein BJ171DRAFT_632146 [Polychytrium aggregatum]KAI9199260.1 hypothetical protein BJ171DRAFT_632146 [Polychytrium aggregatum]
MTDACSQFAFSPAVESYGNLMVATVTLMNCLPMVHRVKKYSIFIAAITSISSLFFGGISRLSMYIVARAYRCVYACAYRCALLADSTNQNAATSCTPIASLELLFFTTQTLAIQGILLYRIVRFGQSLSHVVQKAVLILFIIYVLVGVYRFVAIKSAVLPLCQWMMVDPFKSVFSGASFILDIVVFATSSYLIWGKPVSAGIVLSSMDDISDKPGYQPDETELEKAQILPKNLYYSACNLCIHIAYLWYSQSTFGASWFVIDQVRNVIDCYFCYDAILGEVLDSVCADATDRTLRLQKGTSFLGQPQTAKLQREKKRINSERNMMHTSSTDIDKFSMKADRVDNNPRYGAPSSINNGPSTTPQAMGTPISGTRSRNSSAEMLKNL